MMTINKAKAKRALALGTMWTVKNMHNLAWNPGIRTVVKVQSNAVGFNTEKGTSWLWLDQTDDKVMVNEESTRIEIHTAGELVLVYDKVNESNEPPETTI